MPEPVPGVPASPREALPVVLSPSLRSRVGVEQIGFQHAFFDHYRTPGGHSFTVKRRGAKSADHGAIINQRDVFTKNLFAQLIGQECSLTIDCVAGGGFK